MRRLRTIFLALILTGSIGLSQTNSHHSDLYMVSTIHALIEGLYDGEITLHELKRHGNLGIGAADAMDGELIVLDNKCYQVKADGSVIILDDRQKTPYATVIQFKPDRVFESAEGMDFPKLKGWLDEQLSNPNMPYAFRIEGEFSYVKTRSVPRQKKPYPRLIEVIKNQPEFEFKNIKGVIVGFRLPEHLDSLGVPGYHFHFLTADRRGGGHLLAFRAGRLHVAAEIATGMKVDLPRSEAFMKLNLTYRNKTEIDQIMGRIPLK